MRKNRSRKKSRFFPGMLVYALVFVCITIVAMRVLWRFLEAYEASRPTHIVEEYELKLNSGEYSLLMENYINSIADGIQPKEEISEYLLGLSDSESVLKKVPGECTDDCLVYAIVNGGKAVGRARFVPGEELAYGFSAWAFDSAEVNFDFLATGSGSVTIPEDYTVFCCGTQLGKDFISDSGVHYNCLEDYYDAYPGLPKLTSYTVSGWYGEVAFTCTDSTGKAVPIPENPEEMIPVTCYEETRDAVGTALEDFITYYYRFSAGVRSMAKTNYNALAKYMVPGSAIQQRISASVESMEWSQSRTSEMSDFTIYSIIELDSAHYLCSLSYTTTVSQPSGDVVTINNVRVMMDAVEGGYLAEDMAYY